MPWVEHHETAADSEESARRGWIEFLERSDLRMHLFLKNTETLVGSSGLHRIDWSVPKFEIGYWCRTSFAGRGYTTEAVRGIAAFAFDAVDANRVEIRCDSLNRRSIRVAERAGFRLEGEIRNAELGADGSLRNTLVFSMLSEEREASREAPGPENG
jgi:RimJ/RimL family protein N-acetyltransferase